MEGNGSRLVFVLNSLGVGGSESKVVRIVNALVRSGCGAEIAYLNPPETLSKRIDRSVPVTALGRRRMYSFGALQRLCALIGNEPCTVVAVNLYPLLYVIPAVKIWSRGTSTAVALINTAKLGDRATLSRGLYSRILRECDRIIYGCETQLRAWTDLHKLPEVRSEVIYNGVDETHFAPTFDQEASAAIRRENGIPDDAFVVGSVGRLASEKGLDLLIRALGRLNASGAHMFLTLVGEGPERQKLERLSARVGVAGQVRFLGLMDDVRPALSTFDVFILPSIAVETFSNAALEAMAMGRAVVLSDVGGANEMVEHGSSGMIVSAGDIDELVTVLAMLRDCTELRQKLGVQARARVQYLFKQSDMIERYRRLASR
jgi:glycosyltransferase involved in cell wall biosynthesis